MKAVFASLQSLHADWKKRANEERAFPASFEADQAGRTSFVAVFVKAVGNSPKTSLDWLYFCSFPNWDSTGLSAGWSFETLPPLQVVKTFQLQQREFATSLISENCSRYLQATVTHYSPGRGKMSILIINGQSFSFSCEKKSSCTGKFKTVNIVIHKVLQQSNFNLWIEVLVWILKRNCNFNILEIIAWFWDNWAWFVYCHNWLFEQTNKGLVMCWFHRHFVLLRPVTFTQPIACDVCALMLMHLHQWKWICNGASFANQLYDKNCDWDLMNLWIIDYFQICMIYWKIRRVIIILRRFLIDAIVLLRFNQYFNR